MACICIYVFVFEIQIHYVNYVFEQETTFLYYLGHHFLIRNVELTHKEDSYYIKFWEKIKSKTPHGGFIT